MKKFLSLVLALIMTMSLVTVSAGAKDFTDDESLNYEEAVAVMSEIGVIDGYPDGTFKPQNGLTRGAAAKIICNMVLGPTTAAALRADTAPFKDVAVDNQYAGYIAYCVQQGITSGYTDGTYRPAAPLTSFAFMKMLLGALGYDAETEGYVGGNCFIAVAKQAIGIGLNKGLKEDFDGGKLITREEAALFAFNTLQADLVEYDTKITANVNGAEVTIGSSNAFSKSWGSSATRINNIKRDEYIQFAEQYFNKLVKSADTDAFGRPAHTWTWKSEAIGTFVDYTTLVAEFTKKVEYKDLYEAIGKLAAEKYDMYDYVDGADNKVDQAKITKKNDSKVPATGKGVLTQVFVNNDELEFTVVSINTYLGKATADYNKTLETTPVTVYEKYNANAASAATKSFTLSSDDLANVADLKADDFVKVTMTVIGDKYEVQSIEKAEVVSNVTVSAYTTGDDDTLARYYRLTGLTADGEKYDTAEKACYDAELMYHYNNTLDQLKDSTYDLFMDDYGYVLGLQPVKVVDNYIFVVGYQTGVNFIAQAIDKALIITTDGELKTVDIRDDKAQDWDNTNHAWKDMTDFTNSYNVNTWFTYTMDGDTYVLKQEVRNQGRDMSVVNHATDADISGVYADLTTNNPYVAKEGDQAVPAVYGNADSVYIAVKADGTVSEQGSIVKVNGVTTGIKNTNIVGTLTDMNYTNFANGWRSQNTYLQTGWHDTFFIYNDKGYVTYAVVIGEDATSTSNMVFFAKGATGRYYDTDLKGYYVTYDAIMGGQLTTVKVLDDCATSANPAAGELYKATIDKDGYITALTGASANNAYGISAHMNTTDNKAAGYTLSAAGAPAGLTLTLKGATLWVTTPTVNDNYVVIADDCDVFVKVASKSSYSKYDTIEAALGALANDTTIGYVSQVTTVVDKTSGYATTLVITETKAGAPVVADSTVTALAVKSTVASGAVTIAGTTITVDESKTNGHITVAQLKNALTTTGTASANDTIKVELQDWTGTKTAMADTDTVVTGTIVTYTAYKAAGNLTLPPYTVTVVTPAP